jgi:hypothetical protein
MLSLTAKGMPHSGRDGSKAPSRRAARVTILRSASVMKMPGSSVSPMASKTR